MTQLVIFDMDGLMFDTERINFESWMQVARKYGFDFDEPLHSSFIGIRENDIHTYLETIYGVESDIASWRKEVKQTQADYIRTNQTVHMKKGLLDLLDFLDEQGIQKAVASSSSLEMINYYLTLENLTHRFDFVVSGEQVENGKPAPDIFLYACEKAGVSPTEAMVLEDSRNGLKAAKAAGIQNVFVPDRIGVSEEMLELSDVVLDDLSQVIGLLTEK